jgi:hypothetical protein
MRPEHENPEPRETDVTATILTAEDLARRGYSRRAREHAERTGRLRRVRHGVYVSAGDLPSGPDADEAMLELRSRAAAPELHPGTALSHVSALVLHGLPAHDMDTSRVTTTRHRPGSGSRRGDRAICHNADLACAVVEVLGVPVTNPARTIVDVARTNPFAGAVAAADEALRTALCTRADLESELISAAGKVGIARARAVVAFADEGGGSVLESVSRVELDRANLPMPQLQKEFVLPTGSSAFVDMYWEEWGLVAECDGTAKYGIEDGEIAVRRRLRGEKARQNELEGMGLLVRRWQWQDYRARRVPGIVRDAINVRRRAGYRAGGVA